MISGFVYFRAAAAGGVLVAISATPAQPQASPHGFPVSQRGSVTQMVAFTEIAIAYGRPAARGGALFGALVPWDSVWHSGADSAPRVRFSRAAHVFHKPYPGARFDVLRVEAMPEQVSQMESFAIYFPMVLRDETVLRLHWGTTAIPLRIKAPYKPNS